MTFERLRDAWRQLRPLLSLSDLGTTGVVIGLSLVLLIGTGVGVAIAAAFPNSQVPDVSTAPTAHRLASPHVARHTSSRRAAVAQSTTSTTTASVPSNAPAPTSTTIPVSPAVSATSPPPQTPPPFTWGASSAIGGLGGSLSSVTCPIASLCVGGDNAGDVVWTTDPTGGAGSWSVASLAGHDPVDAISCPSATLCVAADQAGVAVSTNPTGGASTWIQTNLESPTAFWTGVSCPSLTLCVAVGKSVIATSANPSGGIWTVAASPNDVDFPKPDPLSSVSCPTPLFCVAVGALGMAYVSTNPTSGTKSWKGTKTDFFTAQICQVCANAANSLVGISCPTPALCIAIDPIGDVITSTDPAAPAPVWTITAVNAEWIPLKFVTCLSSTFCFAGTHFSSAPSTGTWMNAGYQYASAVACPSVSTCVAVSGSDVTVGTFNG